MAQTNYLYSPFTFELIGSEDAMLDLLETEEQGFDVYVVPANSTAITPPGFGANQIPVFDEGLQQWTVENDFRGNWYDPANGALTKIQDIGVTPPPGFVDTPPPAPGYFWDGDSWERTLELAKQQKIFELNDDFNSATSGTVSYLGKDYNFSFEATRRVIALYWMKDHFLSGDWEFIASDGEVVILLNEPEARALVTTVIDAYKPEVLNLYTKLKAVDDAGDVATVDAITY
jgi:hypothetical protein